MQYSIVSNIHLLIDSWWKQLLARLYLLRSRTMDYRSSIPLGSRGLTQNKKHLLKDINI
jgi:hypothetical protein